MWTASHLNILYKATLPYKILELCSFSNSCIYWSPIILIICVHFTNSWNISINFLSHSKLNSFISALSFKNYSSGVKVMLQQFSPNSEEVKLSKDLSSLGAYSLEIVFFPITCIQFSGKYLTKIILFPPLLTGISVRKNLM